jgi:ubiquinone/menaquinone biosynthesis C-methylase UbiE
LRPVDPSLAYHLNELEVARDADSPSHILPEYQADEKAILDIGCGIGQTLSVSGLGADALLVGLDVDLASLAYGQKQFDLIKFVNGRSERLPFADASFDLVIARVALPYTHIPASIHEINRVLKPGGRLWLTLHPFKKIWRQLLQDSKGLNLRGMVFRMYVLLNGVWYHLTGRMFAFPFSGKIESFQTCRRISRNLAKAGFTLLRVKQDPHFLIEARKTGDKNRV